MTPQAPAGDSAARLRIRTSLDESLLVEASAGTGKTTELAVPWGGPPGPRPASPSVLPRRNK